MSPFRRRKSLENKPLEIHSPSLHIKASCAKNKHPRAGNKDYVAAG
jgi:hypothetical protein